MHTFPVREASGRSKSSCKCLDNAFSEENQKRMRKKESSHVCLLFPTCLRSLIGLLSWGSSTQEYYHMSSSQVAKVTTKICTVAHASLPGLPTRWPILYLLLISRILKLNLWKRIVCSNCFHGALHGCHRFHTLHGSPGNQNHQIEMLTSC